MAKIHSHDARTIAQVRATPDGESGTWITLTLTSDGRLLRKVTMAHRSQWGTHYSNSNNKIIGKILPAKFDGKPREEIETGLRVIARRMGYPLAKEA